MFNIGDRVRGKYADSMKGTITSIQGVFLIINLDDGRKGYEGREGGWIKIGGSMSKFEVGEKVRIIEDCMKGSKNKIGTITVVDEGTSFPYRVKPDTYCCPSLGVWCEEKYLQKIGGGMSKYDELKERIEAVTGWDKEADDILNTIYKMGGTHYHISISIANRRDKITIRANGYGGRDIEYFDYASQCGKLAAFKKALMWLLDHSSIPKNIVGEEKKIEIDGKVYKARILEEVK